MGYNRPFREVSTHATHIQGMWSGLDSSRVLYLLVVMVHSSYVGSISSIRGRVVWASFRGNGLTGNQDSCIICLNDTNRTTQANTIHS